VLAAADDLDALGGERCRAREQVVRGGLAAAKRLDQAAREALGDAEFAGQPARPLDAYRDGVDEGQQGGAQLLGNRRDALGEARRLCRIGASSRRFKGPASPP